MYMYGNTCAQNTSCIRCTSVLKFWQGGGAEKGGGGGGGKNVSPLNETLYMYGTTCTHICKVYTLLH